MPQKEFLSAILKGEDTTLSSSLNDVKDAADNATDELSDLNEELQEFSSISIGAEQAADDTEDDINDLKDSSVKAANGVSKLSKKLRDSEDDLITAGENSESLGDALSDIFERAKVGEEGIEDVRKEAKRIVSNFEGAEDKLQSFGRKLGELSAEGEITESSLNELGDKAREILSDFEAAEEGADSFEDELSEAGFDADKLSEDLQELVQFIDEVGDESVEQVPQIETIVDAIDRIEESAEDSDERLRLLKEAIEGAGQESMQHIGSFESAGESVEGMADDATIAVTGMEGLQETLEKVADELETLVRLMKPVVGMLAELSKGARAAGSSMENLSENTEEAADEMGPLMAGIFAASGAAEAGSQTMDRLANRLDDVEDEANEATAAMAGTASMSELLSLQSSALSINVGFFTVALRNLTTQVPLLVASLGTLITTLGGLAGAIGAAGVGGLGIALGGAAAEAERLAGPLEDTENAMEAFSAIAEELKDMFIEALQPLINADGAAEAFISMMEGLATTVNAFSKSIARSFEEGALGQIFDVIGSAWMDSVADITTSIEALVEDVGLPIAENVIEPGIRAFSDFIDFINRTTQKMMSVFGVVGDSVGDFIRQLMQLGITVASGLAPVLNSFFSTVSSVVDAFILTNKEIRKFQDSAEGAGATVEEATEQLSGFRAETIATAVKTGVLLLAVNRFAGILGSVISPLTNIIGKLGLAAQSANTMSGAFLQTAGSITQGISEMSGGFGRLVGAFQMAIPAFASGDASLESFGKTVDEAGGLLSYMAGRLSGARVETIRTSDSVSTLRARLSSLGGMGLSYLRNSITRATDSILTGLIPATRTAEKVTKNVEGYGELTFRPTLTGIDAVTVRAERLKQRLVTMFSNIEYGNIFDTLKTGITDFSETISNFSNNESIDLSVSSARQSVQRLTSDLLTKLIPATKATEKVTESAEGYGKIKYRPRITGIDAITTRIERLKQSIVGTLSNTDFGDIFDTLKTSITDFSNNASLGLSVSSARQNIQALTSDLLTRLVPATKAANSVAGEVVRPQVTGTDAIIARFRRVKQAVVGSITDISSTTQRVFNNTFGALTTRIAEFSNNASISLSIGSARRRVRGLANDLSTRLIPTTIATSGVVQSLRARFAGLSQTRIGSFGFGSVRQRIQSLTGDILNRLVPATRTANTVIDEAGQEIRPRVTGTDAIIARFRRVKQSVVGSITDINSTTLRVFNNTFGALTTRIAEFSNNASISLSISSARRRVQGLANELSTRLIPTTVSTSSVVQSLRNRFVELSQVQLSSFGLSSVRASVRGLTSDLLTRLIPATRATDTVIAEAGQEVRPRVTGIDAIRAKLKRLGSFVRSAPAKAFNTATDAIGDALIGAGNRVGALSNSIKEAGGVAQFVGSTIFNAFIKSVGLLPQLGRSAIETKQRLSELGPAGYSALVTLRNAALSVGPSLETISNTAETVSLRIYEMAVSGASALVTLKDAAFSVGPSLETIENVAYTAGSQIYEMAVAGGSALVTLKDAAFSVGPSLETIGDVARSVGSEILGAFKRAGRAISLVAHAGLELQSRLFDLGAAGLSTFSTIMDSAWNTVSSISSVREAAEMARSAIYQMAVSGGSVLVSLKDTAFSVGPSLETISNTSELVRSRIYEMGVAGVSAASSIKDGALSAISPIIGIGASIQRSAENLLYFKKVSSLPGPGPSLVRANSKTEALIDSLRGLGQYVRGGLVSSFERFKGLPGINRVFGDSGGVIQSLQRVEQYISGSFVSAFEASVPSIVKLRNSIYDLRQSVTNLLPSLGGIRAGAERVVGGLGGLHEGMRSVGESMRFATSNATEFKDALELVYGAAEVTDKPVIASQAIAESFDVTNMDEVMPDLEHVSDNMAERADEFFDDAIPARRLEEKIESGDIDVEQLVKEKYIDPVVSPFKNIESRLDPVLSPLENLRSRIMSTRIGDAFSSINDVLSRGLTANLDLLSTKLTQTGQRFKELDAAAVRSRLSLSNLTEAAVGTLSTIGLIGENSVASALGIDRLSVSASDVTENLSEMNIAGRNVSDTIREAGNEFREFAGKEVAAVETTEDVKEEILGVISATEVGEDNVGRLSRELANLASDGKLAEKSQEDLKKTMNRVLTNAQVTDEQIEELAGKELYAAETTDEMKKELFGLAGAAELGEGHIDNLSEKMEELAADGKLAEMSSEELTEELAQVGLASEFTDGQIDELGEEMTEASIRARLFAGASYGLSGALGVLSTVATAAAVSTGAILAAVAALVVIVGSAAAALMVLGESGKGAEEIIADLQETLRDIAETVMPLVVDSGNMMIDVFRSFKTAVGELIAGYKDIGVALGIIEEGAGDGASGMDMLAAAVETLRPIIQGIGDAFRVVFGNFATFIRDAFDDISAFLERYNAEEKIDTFVATVGRLYEELQKLKEPVKEFLAAAATVNVKVFKSLGKEIMEVADAMLGAFGLGEDIFGNIMSFIEGVGIYIYRLIPPIIDLMMSLGDAIGGGLMALFGGLGAILEGIAGVIGFVVDGIMAFLDGLTGDNAGGFLQGVVDSLQTIMRLVGPAISLIADAVDVIAMFGGVGAAFLGEFWGFITNIASFIGDVLLPLIEGFGASLRYQFMVIKKTITGTFDFIMRNFEFVVDFVTALIERDFMGAFNAIKTFIVDTFSGLVDFFAYVFGEAGRIAYEALAGIVETIVNGFLSIPDAVTSAFDKIGDAIVNAIAGPWNDAIAGSYTIAKVPDWLPVPYSGESFDLNIGKLGTAGGDSGGGGGDSGGAVGSDAGGQLGRLAENVAEDTDELPDVTISDATKDQEDLSGGGSTAGDFMDKVTDMVMPGGGPNNVTYNEGDTNNSFQQDISADPQDKAQIGRVAKDAMQEANEFARRRQGSQ